MAAFEYNVLNQHGKQIKGLMEGDSVRQISQKLKEQSLIPLEIKAIKHKNPQQTKRLFIFRRGISNYHLAVLTRQLSTMIRSGNPIENALTAVIQQSHVSRVKSILMAIRSRVREGYSFSDALDEFPDVFPDLYRSTISSGEKAGKLDYVLEQMALHIERTQALKSKMMLALIYPIVLTMVSILVTIALLTYVVPKVTQVFENMDQTLPFITRLLIQISEFMTNYGLYLILIFLVAVMIFMALMKIAAFKIRWHAFLLVIPGLSVFIRAVNTALFSRTFSILFGSGVNALDSLKISAHVMKNKTMVNAVLEASEKVREGTAISRALEQSHCFPPLLIHLIASGEESGELTNMMEYAANNQEKELESLSGIMMGLFEPLLILFMGSIVLFIVIAILLPIFQLNQLVGV